MLLLDWNPTIKTHHLRTEILARMLGILALPKADPHILTPFVIPQKARKVAPGDGGDKAPVLVEVNGP